MSKPIALNDYVVDGVTSFEGTVIGLATYLAGHTEAQVQPPTRSDGGWVDCKWLPVNRLTVTAPKSGAAGFAA